MNRHGQAMSATDRPYFDCPYCEHPMHPAEPCECRGGRSSGGDYCLCGGTGWVWRETWPDPPVSCPECGTMSVVDVDEDRAFVREVDS